MHAAHDLQQTLEDADADTGPVPQEPTTPEAAGSIAAAMDTAGDDEPGLRGRGEAPPSA
jgi:predicted enzyme related to lactoylglutathione lyase